MKLTKSKFFWTIIFTLSLIIFPFISYALTPQEVPNPQQSYGGWVTDMANVLSEDTEAKLNQQISALEAKNGTEIAIVTVKETQPSATPKQFTTELFNYWGIGKQGIDNGVLFFSFEQIIGLIIGVTLALNGWLLRKTGIKNLRKPITVKSGTIERIKPSAIKLYNFDHKICLGNLLLIGALIVVTSVSLFPIIDTILEVLIPFLIFFSIFSLLFILVITIIAKEISSSMGLFHSKEKKNSNKFICEECSTPMESVEKEEFIPLLNRPQKVANQIGSIEFLGYKCPQCYSDEHTLKDCYVRAYVSNSNKFKTCPNCQELTVTTSSKTLVSPNYNHSGKKEITLKCHCCDYTEQHIEIIPQLTRSSSSSSSRSSYGGYGGYDSGGSSSDGGGFGGGSSGGGGAGGDY